MFPGTGRPSCPPDWGSENGDGIYFPKRGPVPRRANMYSVPVFLQRSHGMTVIVTAFENSPDRGEERLPLFDDERVRTRLRQLSARLGESEWLDGGLSAGDLPMVTVLRRLEGWGMIEDHPKLAAHTARGEARPACKRAFDAQYAVFAGASAGSPETSA